MSGFSSGFNLQINILKSDVDSLLGKRLILPSF